MSIRTAFFISDRTGITAEILGNSLLTQFPDIKLKRVVRPFIDSIDDAEKVCNEIALAAAQDTEKPLVFATLINPAIREILARSEGYLLDFMAALLPEMESALGVQATPEAGLSHRIDDAAAYEQRINSINFTLSHDDGIRPDQYDKADIILVGVSRSGKTPTSLYLAIQYGIRAANYPLVPEDLENNRLPGVLEKYRKKLYGLSITPRRLQQIRYERRPDSTYSSIAQCELEVKRSKSLFTANGIPNINTTLMSIEEISTTIVHHAGLRRNSV